MLTAGMANSKGPREPAGTSAAAQPDPHRAAHAACVIAARDEADRIAQAVRAAKELDGVDAVIVVDDASSDDTASRARGAGAQVLAHDYAKGVAAAQFTGACAVRNRDISAVLPGAPLKLRPVLFGSVPHAPDSAAAAFAAASALIEPVVSGEADAAVSADPQGWRCLSRRALDSAHPAGQAVRADQEISRARAADLRVVEVHLPGIQPQHTTPLGARLRGLLTGRGVHTKGGQR